MKLMTNKTAKQIGHNLKQQREHQGFTQSDFANKVGINTNYYAKLEQGQSTPSLQMLERIVKALKIHSSNILPF